MKIYIGILVIYCFYTVSRAADIPSPPAYIFSRGNQICTYNATNLTLPKVNETYNCFWSKNDYQAAVFDMHLGDNVLILAHLNKIDRLALDQANSTAAKKFNRSLVVSTGHITDISVDWVAGNIYFVDNDMYNVEVTDLEGAYALTVHKNVTGIWGIAVDPINRFIFWTRPSKTNPAIGRSNLDGTNKQDKFIVGTDVEQPHHICVDHNEQRVYWTDYQGGIQSAKIDGTDHRIIFSDATYFPYSIIVSKSHIIWTENKPYSDSSGVYWTSKSSGNHSIIDRHVTYGDILDIVYYSDYSQPKGHTNACSGSTNGGCSQICLPGTSTTKTCKCSLGSQLASDGQKCEAVPLTNYKDALFIGDTGRGHIFAMNTTTQTVSVLPIPRQRELLSLVVDPMDDSIYWSDSVTDTIMKGSITSGAVKKILSIPGHSIHTIALDYKKKILFYADYKKKNVSSVTYDGANKKTIISGQEIMSLVADVQYQKLYMAVVNPVGKIQMTNYDGTQKKTLISYRSDYPLGLTIDFNKRTMYWVQHGRSRIVKAQLDGTRRQTILSSQESFSRLAVYPKELTLLGRYVYIADWKSNNQLSRIHYANTSTSMSDFGTDKFLHTSSITTYPTVYGDKTTTTTEKPTMKPVTTKKPVTKPPDIGAKTTTTTEKPTMKPVTTKKPVTKPLGDNTRTTPTSTTQSQNGAQGVNGEPAKGSTGSEAKGDNTVAVAIGVALGILALVIIGLSIAVFVYCRNKGKPANVQEPTVSFENPGYADIGVSVPYETLANMHAPQTGAEGKSPVNIQFDERSSNIYDKLKY